MQDPDITGSAELIQDSAIKELQNSHDFDVNQIAVLGTYVYALRDPRDNKVFYVGQGTGSRVTQHFEEARRFLVSGAGISTASSKIRRIVDIWLADMAVEWCIVSCDIVNSRGSKADLIESACYDLLTWSQNGSLTNEVAPPKSFFLHSDELVDLAAPRACLNIQTRVFLFNITKSLHSRASRYDETRMFWRISQKWREQGAVDYGVGLVGGISKTAYKIDHWVLTDNSAHTGKYEFESPNHPNPNVETFLLNLNWRHIVNNLGYWKQGNPIVVEFDGKGNYRVLRGVQGTSEWMPC